MAHEIRILGDPVIGSQLTAAADLNLVKKLAGGEANVKCKFQWYRSGSQNTSKAQPPLGPWIPIASATKPMYTPSAEDGLCWLRVEVSPIGITGAQLVGVTGPVAMPNTLPTTQPATASAGNLMEPGALFQNSQAQLPDLGPLSNVSQPGSTSQLGSAMQQLQQISRIIASQNVAQVPMFNPTASSAQPMSESFQQIQAPFQLDAPSSTSLLSDISNNPNARSPSRSAAELLASVLPPLLGTGAAPYTDTTSSQPPSLQSAVADVINKMDALKVRLSRDLDDRRIAHQDYEAIRDTIMRASLPSSPTQQPAATSQPMPSASQPPTSPYGSPQRASEFNQPIPPTLYKSSPQQTPHRDSVSSPSSPVLAASLDKLLQQHERAVERIVEEHTVVQQQIASPQAIADYLASTVNSPQMRSRIESAATELIQPRPQQADTAPRDASPLRNSVAELFGYTDPAIATAQQQRYQNAPQPLVPAQQQPGTITSQQYSTGPSSRHAPLLPQPSAPQTAAASEWHSRRTSHASMPPQHPGLQPEVSDSSFASMPDPPPLPATSSSQPASASAAFQQQAGRGPSSPTYLRSMTMPTMTHHHAQEDLSFPSKPSHTSPPTRSHSFKQQADTPRVQPTIPSTFSDPPVPPPSDAFAAFQPSPSSSPRRLGHSATMQPSREVHQEQGARVLSKSMSASATTAMQAPLPAALQGLPENIRNLVQSMYYTDPSQPSQMAASTASQPMLRSQSFQQHNAAHLPPHSQSMRQLNSAAGTHPSSQNQSHSQVPVRGLSSQTSMHSAQQHALGLGVGFADTAAQARAASLLKAAADAGLNLSDADLAATLASEAFGSHVPDDAMQQHVADPTDTGRQGLDEEELLFTMSGQNGQLAAQLAGFAKQNAELASKAEAAQKLNEQLQHALAVAVAKLEQASATATGAAAQQGATTTGTGTQNEGSHGADGGIRAVGTAYHPVAGTTIPTTANMPTTADHPTAGTFASASTQPVSAELERHVRRWKAKKALLKQQLLSWQYTAWRYAAAWKKAKLQLQTLKVQYPDIMKNTTIPDSPPPFKTPTKHQPATRRHASPAHMAQHAMQSAHRGDETVAPRTALDAGTMQQKLAKTSEDVREKLSSILAQAAHLSDTSNSETLSVEVLQRPHTSVSPARHQTGRPMPWEGEGDLIGKEGVGRVRSRGRDREAQLVASAAAAHAHAAAMKSSPLRASRFLSPARQHRPPHSLKGASPKRQLHAPASTNAIQTQYLMYEPYPGYQPPWIPPGSRNSYSPEKHGVRLGDVV